MSVLIKSMNMPSTCSDCNFLDDSGDYPTCLCTHISRGYNFNIRAKRMGNCPLIEIPKHGDLIDRDAVIDKMCLDYTAAERNGKLMYASVEVKQGFCDLLTDAPTVIEAEE